MERRYLTRVIKKGDLEIVKRDIFQAHPLLCFPSWSHLSDRRSVEVLALIPDTSLSYVWLILRRCDDLLLDLVTPPRAKVISKSEGTSLRVRNITYFPPPFFSLSKFKFIHRQDKFSSSSTTKKLVIEIELSFPTNKFTIITIIKYIKENKKKESSRFVNFTAVNMTMEAFSARKSRLVGKRCHIIVSDFQFGESV